MLEPSPGRYQFALADRIIDLHARAGISPLLTVECLSPWATRTKVRNLRTFAASPPKDMARYEAFLEKVVSRYRGRVKYWQIGNEVFDHRLLPVTWYGWDGTREEYIDLLKHSSQVIKRTDPEARVVLAGFAHELFSKIISNEPPGIVSQNEAREFFEYVLHKGSSYYDMVDFHQYRRPEDVYGMVGLLRDTMEKYGIQKDIISTEAGDIDIRLFAEYFVTPGDAADFVVCLMKMPRVQKKLKQIAQGGIKPREYTDFARFLAQDRDTRPVVERYQAEYLVKRMTISLSRGIKIIYSASIRDNPYPVDWYWAIMSLCDVSGRKKPHFHTYRLLIEKLRHFKGAEEIAVRKNIKAFRFTFPARPPLLVLWAVKGTERVDLSPVLTGTEVAVTRIITEQGKTWKDAVVEKIQSRSVILDPTPVFVE